MFSEFNFMVSNVLNRELFSNFLMEFFLSIYEGNNNDDPFQ